MYSLAENKEHYSKINVEKNAYEKEGYIGISLCDANSWCYTNCV